MTEFKAFYSVVGEHTRKHAPTQSHNVKCVKQICQKHPQLHTQQPIHKIKKTLFSKRIIAQLLTEAIVESPSAYKKEEHSTANNTPNRLRLDKSQCIS